MYSSTYCKVYTLFAGLGLFTKLMSIFVLIFILLSLSAFVRFLLKKLLACLLDTKAAARQSPNCIKQELSYRKQIARQLRTQYVEGIYRSNYP